MSEPDLVTFPVYLMRGEMIELGGNYNELAGTPIPNLPSCLRCIIRRLVGLRRSLVRCKSQDATVVC